MWAVERTMKSHVVDKHPYYVGVSSLSIFGGDFATSGPDQCPLFEVERCPLLGGSKCISSTIKDK